MFKAGAVHSPSNLGQEWTRRTFTLEGAVIDSRSAASLGVISERGDVAQLFKAQKTMTFGILRAAGIALDQLPAEVRQRLERFQTTNLDAFRAFSTGLDLKDQGRYAEAKDFFRRAADLDPGFGLAADQQRAMPDVTVSGQAQARAVVIAAAGYAENFGHGLGHGVGLQIHEAPGINATATGTLPAGAAVTVEPGVYLPGRGGVRIEDTLIVAGDTSGAGDEQPPELLTRFPKELNIL